jgi:hypothetical protein
MAQDLHAQRQAIDSGQTSLTSINATGGLPAAEIYAWHRQLIGRWH